MTKGGLIKAFSLAVAAAGMLRAAPAAAYPQWQLSTGAVRCNQCHFAPAGSGLINSYGRYIIGDELSTFEGNGALLHGAAKLPAWLAVGGDLRGAVVAQDVQDPSGSTLAAFPMQADAEAMLTVSAFSFYGTAGERGQIRPNEPIVPIQNYQPISTSRFISREHWLLWEPAAQGPYARVGRFFAPFGLRLAEHITYIRRDLGFDQLEESYNVSGGYITDAWEAHVTAFAPDFIRHIGSDETGVAGYYERRVLNQAGSFALQAKYASAPGATRTIVGAFGKYYIEPLHTLLMAEGDFVRLSLDNNVPGRAQLVGLAGVSVFPARGVLVTLLGELNQEDLLVRGAGRTATTALLGWFPYAHVELQVMGRAEFPVGTPATKTLFAQIHYFL
jgi:hypothetical protein